jgi:hypothetical protein
VSETTAGAWNFKLPKAICRSCAIQLVRAAFPPYIAQFNYSNEDNSHANEDDSTKKRG